MEAEQLQKEQTELFMRELKEYEDATVKNQPDTHTTRQMRGFMDEYYNDLKANMGINDKFGEDEEQPLLVDAIQTLRPNMNPDHFIDLMKKKDNI